MIQKPEKGLFVVGTGTEVGKTYVTCLIAKQLVDRQIRVGVYKPVASGCIHRGENLFSEDADELWNTAGCPESLDAVTPQKFEAPLAPNVAARQEGRAVDRQLLRTGINVWSSYDFLLVEGVGGLMSPVSDEDLVIDLAVDISYPVLVVVANKLGCINETLLTLNALQQRRLNVAGIVLNSPNASADASDVTNRGEIERLSDIPVWDQLAFQATKIELAKLAI